MKQTQNKPTRHSAARIAALVLCALFLLFALLPVIVRAENESAVPAPSLASAHALVYNLQYDKILYDKAAGEVIFPASFAKIMTAILVYEYRAEVASPAPVTVTEQDDLSLNGLGLRIGEVVPFDDLAAAMVVGSANDASAVLARAVSGSVSAFVARMNERAKELGAVNTVFANPTGLHNGKAHTTLADMAKICSRAYELNDYIQTASLIRYEIAGTNLHEKPRTVTNSNSLLNPRKDLGYYVEGAMGINHGYTPESGFCVASVREAAGAINLVLVSGGSKNEGNQNTALLDAKALFAYAENAFVITKVLEKGSIIQEAPVRLSDAADHILLIAGSDVVSLLPVDLNRVTDLEQKIFLSEEELTAPIVEGTSFGTVEYYYKGLLIGSAELVAQRSLPRSTSLYLWSGIENFLQLPAVRVVLISLAITLAAFLILCLILLFIQRRRKSGETPQMRRERKRLEKALIKKEKLRQKEYVHTQRALRRKRVRAFRAEMEKLREERLRREQAELERERAAARAHAAARPRPAAGNPGTRPNPRPAAGSTGTRPNPRPAAGSAGTRPNPRPAEGSEGFRPAPNTRPDQPKKRS